MDDNIDHRACNGCILDGHDECTDVDGKVLMRRPPPLKCEWCDRVVEHEREHYRDVRDDNDTPILECSGWTCEEPCGVQFWRERALKAEELLKTAYPLVEELNVMLRGATRGNV